MKIVYSAYIWILTLHLTLLSLHDHQIHRHSKFPVWKDAMKAGWFLHPARILVTFERSSDKTIKDVTYFHCFTPSLHTRGCNGHVVRADRWWLFRNIRLWKEARHQKSYYTEKRTVRMYTKNWSFIICQWGPLRIIQYCHCYNITLCCIEKLTNFKDRQFRAECCTNDRENDKLNDEETNFWQIRFSPNGVFLALYIYASTI